MVLVLAVHTVATVSATVPFAMIMLRDHVKKNDVSPGLHCRLVLPSSGNRSVSLWDVPDKETLQTWLDEFLDVDCSNEVSEVHEEFSYGVSEQLLRARAAEQVAVTAHQTADQVQQKGKRIGENVRHQWDEVDQKFKVSEHASVAIKSAKETVAPVFTKVNSAAKQQYSKALENERVAAAAASVGGGLAAVKGSLGSWGTYFKGQADKVGENVMHRTGSPGLSSRGASQATSSSSPAPAAAQGSPTANPVRQEAMRAATGSATGRDTTAKSTPIASEPSQPSSQPAAQKASQPAAKLDESLFTLDDLSSEDGGSPTAVKGVVKPKEGKPGQSPSSG
ncbi:hypothetical protein ABBQ32_000073 [Trebouxia sp. C0010 RCD-2024]